MPVLKSILQPMFMPLAVIFSSFFHVPLYLNFNYQSLHYSAILIKFLSGDVLWKKSQYRVGFFLVSPPMLPLPLSENTTSKSLLD